MEIIKRYIIMIASIVVAIAAIFALVLGRSRFSAAQASIASAKSLADQVRSLRAGVSVVDAKGETHKLMPTEEAIEKVRDANRDLVKDAYMARQKTLHANIGFDKEAGKTRRQMILDGIFPEPRSEDLPYSFRIKYRKKITEYPAQLNAGGLPSAMDILKKKESLEQQVGLMSDKLFKEIQARQRDSGDKDSAKDQDQQGGITANQLQAWARNEAAIDKAKKIKMYISNASFDIVPEMYDDMSGKPPTIDMMWWAQLSLWMQDDILAALAKTNEKAANVSESVVKHLVSLRIQHGYDLGKVGGGKKFVQAGGLSNWPPSFTKVRTTSHYDVLRFSLDVIVDATRLPEMIDALYQQGHYMLYWWDITALNDYTAIAQSRRSKQSIGEDLYRYGHQPLVRFTSFWETILFRDFYHWGIVGYTIDAESGKTTFNLLGGQTAEGKSVTDREGLKGLMPKQIRDIMVAVASEGEAPAGDAKRSRSNRGGSRR